MGKLVPGAIYAALRYELGPWPVDGAGYQFV